MPAFQLEPDAAGAYAEWNFTGGASALACVQDDNDSNFISLNVNQTDKRHYFTFGDLPAEAVGVTPPVKHHGRWRTNAANNTGWAGLRYSTTNSETQVTIPTTGTYYDLEYDFNDCPGSTGWTVAQLNATEVGVRGTTAATAALIQNRLYVKGNYFVAGACFIPLLSLVAAAIGPGLQLAHMPGLARAIFARHATRCRTMIRPDEYQAALASWRAYRFPRFAFLSYSSCGLCRHGDVK